jgi:hypothetical protein
MPRSATLTKLWEQVGGIPLRYRSIFLPALDLALVARFVMREDQDVALREFADAVSQGRT